MVEATVIAFTKPRRTYQFQGVTRQIRRSCTPTETAGSSYRESPALISRPIWERSIPASVIAFSANSHAVLEVLALSPNRGEVLIPARRLQQALRHAQTLIGLGQLLIEVVARSDLEQLMGDGQQSCISVANVRVRADLIGGCIQQWCGP